MWTASSVDFERYENIGVVANSPGADEDKLKYFLSELQRLERGKSWTKGDLVDLFNEVIENFNHIETGRIWIKGCNFVALG